MEDKHAKIRWKKKTKFYYRQFNSHLEEKEHQLLSEIQVNKELIEKLEFIAKEDLNSFFHLQHKLLEKEQKLEKWMIELKFLKKCYSLEKMKFKIHMKDYYKELWRNLLKKLIEQFWLLIEICRCNNMKN